MKVEHAFADLPDTGTQLELSLFEGFGFAFFELGDDGLGSVTPGGESGELFCVTHGSLPLCLDYWPVRRAAGEHVVEALDVGPPLPRLVHALAAHLAEFPPGPDGLVFTLEGEPMNRQAFGRLWRPAARSARIPDGTGLHLLRHYYASLLIRYGESVKTVQARLGHATAAETLDTYSHLWPDSDDRTREAVDSQLGADSRASADSVRTRASPWLHMRRSASVTWTSRAVGRDTSSTSGNR